MHVIDPATNLAPLWARVRASFARAGAATGGAAKIARYATLTKLLRCELIGWIALIEHFVRKLLFAEAARLDPGTAGLQARTAPPPTAAQTSNQVRAPDLTAPETWSARFSLAPPRDPRAVPEANAPRIRALWGPPPPPPPPPPALQAPRDSDKPFHLARRFEALRRVLENYAPHARRLARLMHRLVRRFPEAIHRVVFSGPRVDFFDREDDRLGIDCSAAAHAHWRAFDSS